MTLFEQLHHLTGVRLLRERSPEWYVFGHALIHEATYGTVLRRERRMLHQVVGETLEAQLAVEEGVLGDVAYHFFAAGVWDKALRYAQQAGEKAQAMYAPREALSHFTRALEAARQLGQATPLALLRARGKTHEVLGNFAAAQADHATALTAARAAPDPQTEWQALMDLGFLWAARDYEQTGAYLQQALALARQLGAAPLLGHTLNRLGNWLVNIERPAEALQHHQEALEIFERLPEPAAGLAETLDLLGMTHMMLGQVARGQRYQRRALALFEAANDRASLPSVLTSIAAIGVTMETRLNVPVAASMGTEERTAQRALLLAQGLGARAAETYACLVLGHVLAEQGRLAEAWHFAERGLAIAVEIGHYQWQSFAHLLLGMLYVEAQAWPQAHAHYTQGLALAQQVGSVFWTRVLSAEVAEVCVHLGRLAEAEALLHPQLGEAGYRAQPAAFPTDLPTEMTWAQRWRWQARICLAQAQGAAALALSWVEQLIAATPELELGQEQTVPHLMLLKGKILLDLQQWATAATTLQMALAGAHAQGRKVLLWPIHLALAQALHGQGQPTAAQAHLAQAQQAMAALSDALPTPELRAHFLQQTEQRLQHAGINPEA